VFILISVLSILIVEFSILIVVLSILIVVLSLLYCFAEAAFFTRLIFNEYEIFFDIMES